MNSMTTTIAMIIVKKVVKLTEGFADGGEDDEKYGEVKETGT